MLDRPRYGHDATLPHLTRFPMNNVVSLPCSKASTHQVFSFSTYRTCSLFLKFSPLVTVADRLARIILRILHACMVEATSLASHMLVIEGYQPSARLMQPPYFCSCVETPGLGPCDSTAEASSVAQQLRDIRAYYTRFRPWHKERDALRSQVRMGGADIPCQVLSLDGVELLTQLCVVSNLVKIGSRPGLFTSFTEVEEGIARIWRDWLRRASASPGKADDSTSLVAHAGRVKQKTKGKTNDKAMSATVEEDNTRIEDSGDRAARPHKQWPSMEDPTIVNLDQPSTEHRPQTQRSRVQFETKCSDIDSRGRGAPNEVRNLLPWHPYQYVMEREMSL